MQRASFVKSVCLLLLIVMQLTVGAPNPTPSNSCTDGGNPQTQLNTTTGMGPKVSICHDNADIAFVVDVSGSIEGDGKNPGYFNLYVRPFLKNFVGKLNVAPGKIQIGLVTFGNEGKLQFPLMSNSGDIMKKIDGIVYNSFGENTNTSGGINVMRTQVLSPKSPRYRPDATHIAIVVTDGLSTYDHSKTVPSANQAKEEGNIILTVGVTNLINLKELVDIATPLRDFNITGFQDAILTGVFRSNGYVSYVPEIKDLVLVVNELASRIAKAAC